MRTVQCTPNTKGKIDNSSKSDSVDEVIKYVDENFHHDISLQNIAERAGLSPTYMSEQFKKRTGENFTEYITHLRIKKAKNLLETSELKVIEISKLIGYNDSSYFIKVFKRVTNQTPKEFRFSCSNKKPKISGNF